MIRQRMMRWHVVLAMVMICSLVFVRSMPVAGAFAELAENRPHGGVRVLAAGETGVTFEVEVPWEQLRMEPAGSGYMAVTLPGWLATMQAGAPKLPVRVEAIGVPPAAAVSVNVKPGRVHTRVLEAPVQPVATQQVRFVPPDEFENLSVPPQPTLVVEADGAVYGCDAAYPGVLAEVANDGIVRGQRVAGIAIYPVQYNPVTRELTIYESLTVRVTFASAMSGQTPSPNGLTKGSEPESAVYEQGLGRALLNYETARGWRQQEPAISSLQPEKIEGGQGLSPAEAAPAGGDASAASGTWAPPSPGWRVKVREEGFYKLTYAELLAAGTLAGNPDPRAFRMYNMGTEVAISVAGESDGRFDSGDSIVFYGQAVNSKYTLDNVYWLTHGQGTGLRMGVRDGTPGAAPAPTHTEALRHLETNARYLSSAPGDKDLERFMWDYLYPPSKPSWSSTFALAAPTSGPATLTVAMLGYLEHWRNPDHHARVVLNGTQVGDVQWDGKIWQISTFTIPEGLLIAGNNTIQIVAPNDTGVGYDVIYIDWAKLRYASGFQAEANVLAFSQAVAGTWKYQVNGFTTDQLAVYDLTDPAAVARIEKLSVSGSGSYTLQFQDTVSSERRYWTAATSTYRTVQAIEADTASSLRSITNGADHIIITHHDFAVQAGQLRDFRATQGLRAKLVDVQDVYDEFGYGIVGAAPISDFLAYAYASWQKPAPSFVVLVGDGHYDPKNYLKYGRTSYLPPYLGFVDPVIGETAADNRYVTLDGNDAMPDMMLGRLAVNSGTEASVVVNKIITYEQGPASVDWRKRVLAVADDGDFAGDFVLSSDTLLDGYLPDGYVSQKVYYTVTHLTAEATLSAIQAGIDAGQFIVNYIGHGDVNRWAEEGFFKTTDVASLQNGAKLPVVLSMTCYDGSYHYPSATSAMAEVLTRADGKGALASWSPTGEGVASGHDYLDQGFFDAVFDDGLGTLGQATNAGKLNLFAAGAGLDLLDTYLLFGDPATNILETACVAADVDVSIGIAGGEVELTWPAALAATGYDVYRAENEPYFTPTTPYDTGVTSPWPDAKSALGNAATNHTYILRAAGCLPSDSKRVAEFDFNLVPGQ